jgi:Holliday junction resolvase RusA-like endonuclease
MNLTIYGTPITKKNHMKIIRIGSHSGLVQSKQYTAYAEAAKQQIHRQAARPGTGVTPVTVPVNLKCVYYMPSRRRVDLCNLLAATCDILVAAGVLADDNRDIVASHDGSRVYYDKQRPRVEIEIDAWETSSGGPNPVYQWKKGGYAP